MATLPTPLESVACASIGPTLQRGIHLQHRVLCSALEAICSMGIFYGAPHSPQIVLRRQPLLAVLTLPSATRSTVAFSAHVPLSGSTSERWVTLISRVYMLEYVLE
jgi:hypothetical protein